REQCDHRDKRHGATDSSLKADLCVKLPNIDRPEFLLDTVENAAQQLVQATSGQYVELDNLSSEYYIRTEGGINIPQLVRAYADEVLKRDKDQADQYFFDFLQFV